MLTLWIIILLKCDLTVPVQVFFTASVTLLLMSRDILPQKEFTGTNRKFEDMTQLTKDWIGLHH